MIVIRESTEMTIGEFCQKLEEIYYSRFPNSFCKTKFFNGNGYRLDGKPGVYVGGVLANEEEFMSNRNKPKLQTKGSSYSGQIYDLFNLSVRFVFTSYSGDNAVYWTYDDPYEQTNEQFHGPTESDPMPSKFDMRYSYTTIACVTPGDEDYRGTKLNGTKKLRFKDETVDVNQALKNWTKVVDKFYKTVVDLYNTDNIPEIAKQYCDIAEKI